VLAKEASWAADLLEQYPESVREWVLDTQGEPFFKVGSLDQYVRSLGPLRRPQGHFNGEPGAADAIMGRTAFLLAREVSKRGPAIDAVCLVRDMDDQGADRRRGLGQARSEAELLSSFRTVVGCADAMREAWVLAGFEAESPDEVERLEDLRQALGFSPCVEAHRLDAKDESAKKSPKRVLRVLTLGDRDREARCWGESPLALLRDRGDASGLRSFLDEVANTLGGLTRAAGVRS